MIRQLVAMILCVSQLQAQGPARGMLAVEPPEGAFGIRSYKPTVVPPIRRANSARLAKLVRAGKLHITLQDAIALAIENNLDLEVARYGPLSAEWQLRRAEAGGPLRGVPSGNAQIG